MQTSTKNYFMKYVSMLFACNWCEVGLEVVENLVGFLLSQFSITIFVKGFHRHFGFHAAHLVVKSDFF